MSKLNDEPKYCPICLLATCIHSRLSLLAILSPSILGRAGDGLKTMCGSVVYKKIQHHRTPSNGKLSEHLLLLESNLDCERFEQRTALLHSDRVDIRIPNPYLRILFHERMGIAIEISERKILQINYKLFIF